MVLITLMLEGEQALISLAVCLTIFNITVPMCLQENPLILVMGISGHEIESMLFGAK